jgi:hypothetical protein
MNSTSFHQTVQGDSALYCTVNDNLNLRTVMYLTINLTTMVDYYYTSATRLLNVC